MYRNVFVSGARKWHCPSKEAVEQSPSGLRGRVLTTAFAVQVASAEGVLYALTVPQLQLLSRTRVFPSSPTSLLCSPDFQWVFASTQDSDLGPKVSGELCPPLQGPGFVHTRWWVLCPGLWMGLGGWLPAQDQACQ